jgi:hypothetical protein
MRISTLLNAADKLGQDLEYLCSIAEHPDPDFPIVDAITYSQAVTALALQWSFILEDLAENELSDDEEYVKLTTEDIQLLNSYTEAAEEALKLLETTCGIYLQNN